jgi:OTU domain-containing protein 6
MEVETLDQMQARHRRELKDLQGRITNKKKNATKKSRKGVNDECAEMERQVKEQQADQIASLSSTLQAVELVEPGLESAEPNSLPTAEQEVERDSQAAADTSQATSGDASSTAQQPGKKRNRQKERLARRAAEQEAAAQRAEEEASNMTDHRAMESEYMKKTFSAHGLVEQDIAPDGHCLFSAVADQLSQSGIPTGRTDSSEPEYKTVRRAAAAFMTENADDFAPFLEDDLGVYVARIRDTAEWGGQLELTALARRYGAEIRVVQDGRTERIGEDEGGKTGKVLWLAYYRHGYGLGEHYNSLRRKA